MFIKIGRKFINNTAGSGCFHCQGHYIKWYFQHFFFNFKDLSINAKINVLYDRNFIF